MDCREAQSLIIPFIEGKLNDEKTEALISHIKQCNNCYDELEVYFIVLAGTRQLDEDDIADDISDFKGELERYIKERENILLQHRNTHLKKILLGIFSGIFVLSICILSYHVMTKDIDVYAAVRNKVATVLSKSSGETVRKSVEQTLDIHFEVYSGYEPLVINREIMETDEDIHENEVSGDE